MSVPYIPDNAPFSAEQRAWLNGFLAGLFSAEPHTAAETKSPLSIVVYFASQSGTAERLAKKLVKELKSQGHSVELNSLAKVKAADLAAVEHALFLVSTYGEGDPPESSVPFRDALFEESASKLEKMRYAVLALGDRHYEQFCRFGIDLDERLHTLGAVRLLSRVEADVDVDVPFEQWKEGRPPHASRKDSRNQRIPSRYKSFEGAACGVPPIGTGPLQRQSLPCGTAGTQTVDTRRVQQDDDASQLRAW